MVWVLLVRLSGCFLWAGGVRLGLCWVLAAYYGWWAVVFCLGWWASVSVFVVCWFGICHWGCAFWFGSSLVCWFGFLACLGLNFAVCFVGLLEVYSAKFCGGFWVLVLRV